uniref:Uncharacterized protein n=1 Tax=Rhizophora mucronata TaxID=61149 RepID=A0A2P2NBM1_RHIMU
MLGEGSLQASHINIVPLRFLEFSPISDYKYQLFSCISFFLFVSCLICC